MGRLFLIVCLVAAFAVGMVTEASAMEQRLPDDQKIETEGWHHGGGRGHRGGGRGRGWNRGGCYYYN